MSIMVATIPLFNSQMAVEAYYLSSHNGEKMLGLKDNFLKMDDAFSHAGLDIVENIGIEPFTGGKRLFVPLSRMQLLSGLIENIKLDPDRLVCIVPAACASDDHAAACIQKLYENGYKIALEGMTDDSDAFALVYVEYVMLDYTETRFQEWYEHTKRLPSWTPIVFNIPDTDTYDRLKMDTHAFFTGSFYNRPITKSSTEPA